MWRFAVVLALAIGAAAAGWWMIARRNPATVPPPAAAIGTAQPATPGQRRGAELPPADVTLQVNGGRSAEVRAGDAIIFTVTVQGTKPEPAFRLGAPGRPWPGDLRFEVANAAPPWRIEAIGQAETFRLGAEEANQAEFGIGPDEAARIAPGTHEVRAIVSVTGASAAQLASNIVRITVREAGAPDDRSRLEAAARFYLRAERWDDAHRVAARLIAQPGRDATALTLFGDALNGLGRSEEALAAYQDAMAALPKNLAEPPESLIARLNQVQERLEAARQKPPR